MPPTDGAARQRATSLLHLPPLLAELGVSLGAVLEGTGTEAADLRADAYIPFAAYTAILERAALLSGRDDFGLLLGSRQTLASLGPVGHVMRHAATLGEALSDFASLQISNSTGGAVYLHRSGSDFIFGYGIYGAGGAASAQLYDVILAVGSNLIRELTRDAVRPGEFHSIRPVPANLAPYRRMTPSPVRFGQSQTCIFLAKADMAFPLPTADGPARDAALADLMPRLAKAPWGMAGRVRHALRPQMLEGRTRMPEIARRLGMNPRSLRRALVREGATFEAVRDEIRYAVARDLLALTGLPASDIGMTLDLASPSSFVHAFRRWSGTTPVRWRRDFRAGALDEAGAVSP